MAVLGPIDFRGGLCLGYDFPAFPQGKGYSHFMRNCYIKGGCVVPRYSMNKLNSSTFTGNADVLGMAVWTDTVNAKRIVAATSNSKLFLSADMSTYVPQTGVVAFSDQSGALAASSLNGLTTFDSLNNILIGSANSASFGVLFKVTAYNAAGAALGGSPPSADIVKQCNNFLFASRNLSSTTTQSKVYWSNVNDPETWTAANVLDFNKNDGEPIMALGSIGTDLYIFKQNSIGRLSTVTITTSGAVTLGPLVTVVRGVGCCGPRALDNLPSGNIVFVGYDGHFYEFDGSTVVDRSKQPYPGPNNFDQSYFASNNTQFIAMSQCTHDVNTCVKTIRGNNEVWITFQFSNSGNGGMSYVWNFDMNRWYDSQSCNGGGVISTPRSLCEFPISATVSSSNPQESSSLLLLGDTTGRIIYSGDSTHNYPYFGPSATAAQMSIGTFILLKNQDGTPFIPASLCLEVDVPSPTTGGTLHTLTCTIGFDGFSTPTTLFTYTDTNPPPRIIATIPFSLDSTGSNLFPSTLCVVISFVGTSSGTTSNASPDIIRIGSLWLSDEVIN